MKSYDDLQRFKEKTQTNHIEFKDMSEQSLHSDSSNWAIIKQLLSDGTDPVLDKSQRIDVVAPQPIDPSVLLAPPVSAAPAQPLPSFSALDSTPSVGASLFDSISSSLKPGTQPEASAPVTPQPEVSPVAPTTPTVQLTKVADLRPESVAQASGSLFDQLAKSQPNTAQQKHDAPLEQRAAPQLNALLQQPEPTPPNAQPLLQSGFPLPPHPVQPQLNALLQSAPLTPQPQQAVPPQYQSQPVQPQQIVQQPHYSSQQVPAQPLYQPQPVAPLYQSQSQQIAPQPVQQQAAPLYQTQPPAASPLFANSQAMQPNAHAATTSSNISYKQLFSPAHGSAEQIVSKEMPLQSLLEKIASCR